MTRSAARAGGSASVAHGVWWVGAGHVVSQLSWFGSLLLVAALVPPHSFGSVSVAMVVVQVAWLLVGSGTRGAFVVSSRLSRADVRRSTRWTVGTGIAAGLGAALLATPLLRLLAPGADPLVLQALALSVALYGVSIVPLALLQRDMQFKRHAAANAGASTLASALAAGAALAGLGIWALVLRQVLFQGLLAAFAWLAARGLMPATGAGDPPARRDPVARWFFAAAVIAFVSLNVDYVVVGRYVGVAELGLYSLAFTLAFAPVTQFAWQIGKVLFASAARADEAAAVAVRAARAARLSALLVWPLVMPAIVAAPLLLPTLLGPAWRPMVLPFQLLVAAGAVHAVLAVMREFVLGAGGIRACLGIDVAWLLGTVLALLALVPRYGIEGAALAHVALLVPLACGYVTVAARRLGLTPAALWRSMRLIVVAVAVQAATTGLEAVLARWAGATPVAAAAVGILSGGVALCLLLEGGETPPREELAAAARAVRAARAEAVATRRVEAVAAARTADVSVARAADLARAEALAARQLDARESARAGVQATERARTRPLPLHVAGLGLTMAAIFGGTIAAREPHMAGACVAAGLAWLLAVRAPAVHLLALVALTTIVPLAVQARLGSGGSVDSAGVLPSDVLLLTGLARALLVLPRQPLRRLTSAALTLTALFLLAGALQLVHALALGRPISGVGGEFRALLGFGTLFVALPVLADPEQRRRLLSGLGWLGLALGLWGIAQFALHLRFTEVDSPLDLGNFQTAGRVVGLFAFPVAATLALAVLTGDETLTARARLLLAAVVTTNLVAVIFTFERTFLLVTLIGFGLVFVRGTWGQRTRLALSVPFAVVLAGLVLALLAPAALSAYRDRLLTLTSAKTDPAVQYRIVESRLVAQEIRSRPIVGSALGATILIGRPGTNVAPALRRHAENGYLWLAWKVGIPAALAMCALLALAMTAPRPRWEELSGVVLRRGCQAALAAVALASFSFPSFNQTGITALMGVLAAACVAAELAAGPRRRTGVYA
jgi:O-antigen/teichoic acid export membrane protein